jgi:CheY-like chemotaxis protein
MTKPRGKTVASKRGKILRLPAAAPKLVSSSHPPSSRERVHAASELDDLRESLLRQERMRAIGELASGVAHDLNNTLHAMSLRLSLIEQSPVCQAEQGSNINALSRIISDAALVVGRLQDFARQRQERPLESVDVAAVVGEAIDIVRTGIEGQSSLEGAPIRIETELASLPPVPGLASDLRHVIVNLLLNARDAMPRGGTIQVSGELADSRVILKVLDEGRGIPPEHLPKIFDPFFTTKGNRGTGLGLSMAYGVLTRLGGDICAENRPGRGACFTLSFPIASRPSSPSRPAPSSNPPSGRHILVVDDDIDNLEATRMVMELDGQAVDVARSGSEAIEMLRTGVRYDLVLCDLGMPDMNGWRVAREIHDVAPGTTVYMLTGWAQEIADDDPRRKWVKGVLEKPMNHGDLRDLLASELLEQPAIAEKPPPI